MLKFHRTDFTQPVKIISARRLVYPPTNETTVRAAELEKMFDQLS